MKLNGRLMMIAEKIPSCGILVDIGTDHAYIPIYAVKKAICDKALAVDLRVGPLKMALKNIKRYGFEKNIEIRMGNGLEPVLTTECDVIVIAGMGGLLIRDILSLSIEKAQKAKILLLQPNHAADALRKWLYENGFDIVEEKLALEDGKLYCLLSVKWTGIATEKDEFIYYIGEKLFEGEDPLLKTYLLKKIKELDAIITGRRRAAHGRVREANSSAGMSIAQCIHIRNRLEEYVKNNLF